MFFCGSILVRGNWELPSWEGTSLACDVPVTTVHVQYYSIITVYSTVQYNE